MSEDLEKKYPSLKLAYEHVKDVLNEQEQTASDLDTKIATIFGASTAIFGIGMPLILSFLDIKGITKLSDIRQALSIGMITAILVGLVIVSWVIITRKSLNSYGLKKFITMNNPEEIRQNLWSVDNIQFYHEILLNIENAYFENDEKLKQKANITDSLFDWLIIHIVSILSLLLFVFLLKAIGLF
jgi:hypothetical protein